MHVERARVENRVIFTQDDDFLRLHAAGIDHAGIVYTPQGTSIGDIIRGLMLIYQVLDKEAHPHPRPLPLGDEGVLLSPE